MQDESKVKPTLATASNKTPVKYNNLNISTNIQTVYPHSVLMHKSNTPDSHWYSYYLSLEHF